MPTDPRGPVDSEGPAGPLPSTDPATVSGRRREWWWAGGVMLVALVARVVPVWRGGGLSATNGYDDGVYYAAATSFVHGQLPYRDYVLLHPPGSVLLLAPFALLARLTSDSTGFETARVGFMVLGAVNARLVMLIGRRINARVAVVAGLFYALFFPAVFVARTISLEELGTSTSLIALVLVFRVGGQIAPPIPALVAAGAALGLGTTVKIWGVVPLLVIVVWLAVTAGWGPATRVLAGAVGAMIVICLPFYLQAPTAMFRYVVGDQIGRPSSGGSVWSRLRDITGVRPLVSSWPTGPAYALLAVAVLLALAATAAALRRPDSRLFAALLIGGVALLLVSPSFFDHYAGFVAAPGALVVATAADRIPSSRSLSVRSQVTGGTVTGLTSTGVIVTGVMAVVVILLAAPGILRPQGTHVPRALAAAARELPGCVKADDPTVLVLIDAQSRDLRRHCQVWVDVTGITYDTAHGHHPDNGRRQREADPTWQRRIMAYLRSGTATIVSRSDTDLTPVNHAAIERLPVIVRAGQFVLRRVS